MATWIIATRSRGKLAELVPILAAHGISALGLDEAGVPSTPDEDGIEVFDTFTGNALAKARHFAALTGRPCLADDSGLAVDALGGAPGVRSRRFARDRGVLPMPGRDEDECNNKAVVDACLQSGHAPPWSAHYACAVAFVDGDHSSIACGRTDGHLTPARDGAGGVGYDPLFVSDDLGMSFARASREEKSRTSHRGRAIAALLELLATGATGTAAC